MKYILLAMLLSIPFIGWTAENEEPEIVIEMSGENTAAYTPSMWDFSAPQLTKQWRKRTREQVLYDVPVVSDKDYIIRSRSGEYALVEYDRGDDFRKFLFRAETPQTFIAAAANAADVLAVNKKYEVNIGLRREAFEQIYANQATAQHADLLPENIVLYHLSYTDINTPSPQDHWFLFENKKLIQTFYTPEEKEEYLKLWQAPIRQPATPTIPIPKPTAQARVSAKNSPRKALLSGGTVQDQMYMPRVVSSAFKPASPTAAGSNK